MNIPGIFYTDEMEKKCCNVLRIMFKQISNTYQKPVVFLTLILKY